MVISYNKLWKLLIDKSMNKNTLRTNGVNAATIAKMGRNEYVSMETLVRICEILNCDIGDIVECIQDVKE